MINVTVPVVKKEEGTGKKLLALLKKVTKKKDKK